MNIVGSRGAPIAGSIAAAADPTSPKEARLQGELSGQQYLLTCITCIYRISVPKADIGGALIPVGAIRHENGELLQGNKYLDLVPDNPRDVRNKAANMLPTLLFAALLAIQASAGSLPHLGKYARVITPDVASNTAYNYIIAGGGIGGLTVADRLTEDPSSKLSILMLRDLNS